MGSFRTATEFRRAMEAGQSEPYNGELARLEWKQHSWLVLFYLGLGASSERICTFGDPAKKFTEDRLFISKSSQQQLLSSALVSVGSTGHSVESLPALAQQIFHAVHYQNMWCDANQILKTQKELHLQANGAELSEQELREIEHVRAPSRPRPLSITPPSRSHPLDHPSLDQTLS